MSFFITHLFVQSLFATQLNAEPIHCLSCPGVGKPEDCRTTLLCAEGEICETQKYITDDGHVLFELGCKQVDICKSTNALVGTDELRARINNTRAYPLVGRRQLDNIAAYVCIECCDTPYCNNFLCGGHETALECLSCRNAASLDECNQIEVCRPHQSCYVSEELTDRFELRYEAGCLAETNCKREDRCLRHSVEWVYIINCSLGIIPAIQTMALYGKIQTAVYSCTSKLCNEIVEQRQGGLCSKCCRDSLCNNACASTSPTPAQTTITATSNATTTATTMKMSPPSTPYNLGPPQSSPRVLTCGSCKHGASSLPCNETMTCQPNEVCYVREGINEMFQYRHERGCMEISYCEELLREEVLGELGQNICFMCCDENLCNTHCSMARNPMISIRHRISASKVGKAGDVS